MKKYRVMNTFEHPYHDYDIIVDHTYEGHESITLVRSNDHVWSEKNRGESVFTLIDTGNGYIFPKKVFSGEVDYVLTSELCILLGFINKKQTMGLYQGVIEEYEITNTIEI
jgi:hypothetical protein